MLPLRFEVLASIAFGEGAKIEVLKDLAVPTFAESRQLFELEKCLKLSLVLLTRFQQSRPQRDNAGLQLLDMCL